MNDVTVEWVDASSASALTVFVDNLKFLGARPVLDVVFTKLNKLSFREGLCNWITFETRMLKMQLCSALLYC